MKLPEIVKLLANRINQPHVIETYLKKIEVGAYNKGVEDTKKANEVNQEQPTTINDICQCDNQDIINVDMCANCDGTI